MRLITQLKLGMAAIILCTISQAQSILIVGDSISAGFGINAEEGWVALLEEKLQAENHQYQVINASISGDTTTNGLSRLPALLEKHQPNITIIELGGNDGLRATPPTKIAENLSKMIELTQSANSTPLLIGIQLPPNYGDAYLARFLALYPTLGEQHQIAVLPSIVEKVGGNPDLMQNDGIHPNQKGQPLMLEAVWEKLEPLLTPSNS
ncbi:arylesterase [Ignatzschineria rhizosphaerae]|uniref:Arylesterase n=1 Tax=Ignatzschineria rhizosphaerae TaxID=2923279 RepID=A0ABY3X2X9_9GAMM|nr:arylesterase [Ignatzschineria rhizosphaerae]UNM97239.1 arylesterase [Ignatzschineria rhizosphaerae]